MSNVTKLSDAIKFALFVGAASSVASVSALAQDAAAEATTLDRVEVTGSRIKKVDAESAQPVTVITRANIEKSGVTKCLRSVAGGYRFRWFRSFQHHHPNQRFRRFAVRLPARPWLATHLGAG